MEKCLLDPTRGPCSQRSGLGSVWAMASSRSRPADRWARVGIPILALTIGMGWASAATAAGELDPTFGNGGRVVTDLGGDDSAAGMAIQPDGRIVVAGQRVAGSTGGFVVSRYLPDGSLDPSFGENGSVTTDIGQIDGSNAVVLQGDGRIVVAGFAQPPGADDVDVAVARYLSDGELDPSFGVGGVVTTDISGSDAALDVALQPDGAIVVAGRAIRRGFDFALARYLPDGTLDRSFGVGGTVRTEFSGNDVALSVAIQEDGRILAVGNVFNQRQSNFALARYLANGDLDPSFGGDGRVTTAFGPGLNGATDVVLKDDGAILVAGSVVPPRRASNWALARYLPDGSLDHSFGDFGRVSTSFGPLDDFALALVLQPDGRIVAAGTATGIDGGPDFAVARYLSSGALDDSFGGDGRVSTDFEGGEDYALDVALQADGKAVAAGRTLNLETFGLDTVLARYLTDA